MSFEKSLDTVFYVVSISALLYLSAPQKLLAHAIPLLLAIAVFSVLAAASLGGPFAARFRGI